MTIILKWYACPARPIQMEAYSHINLSRVRPLSSFFGKWMLVLLAIAGLYGLIQFTPLQEILTPEKLTSLLSELGVAGPFALIGLMTLAVVVSPIPSLPLDLAAGAAYGPFWGAFYVLIGAEVGAIISFLIGRALGRDVVSRWLKRDVTFCEQCSDHHLIGLMAVARLRPIFSVVWRGTNQDEPQGVCLGNLCGHDTSHFRADLSGKPGRDRAIAIHSCRRTIGAAFSFFAEVDHPTSDVLVGSCVTGEAHGCCVACR
jgi:hypothetical protein